MPVGVYRKKNKRGKFMYFRNGKLISKKSYDSSKSRKRSTRKGAIRKTSRRAYVNTKNRRSMKRTIPHPSVTGMASGLAIASYLNAGRTTTTATGTSLGTVSTTSEGVIKDITDGQLGTAFNTLSRNAVNMIGTDGGRKTLVTAGGVALLGAFARRQFPQLKLGGSKLYFRL